MKLLWALALRNLLSHRAKSLVVGSIMLGGTLLVVVGLAVLDGIETSMRRSITGSVAGDFQVWSADAKDPLTLLGSSFIASPDVGQVEDIAAPIEVLSAVEGVAAVVPMGTEIGQLSPPGELERAIEDLRIAVRGGEGAERAVDVVSGLVEDLVDELETRKEISADVAALDAKLRTLEPFRTGGEGWTDLSSDSTRVLERLDTEIAPLGGGSRQIIFKYIGTDLDGLAEHFTGFHVVKGEKVPTGMRGFMFPDFVYEHRLKHPVAKYFDRIAQDRADGLPIDEDPSQKARVERLPRQWRSISRQLDSAEAEALTPKLRDFLGQPEGELSDLLEALLTFDGSTFDARKDFFYREIAPALRMYVYAPGDILTLRSYTRSGFLRAVNVRFYGTYAFSGLEDSELAGLFNLTDLVTFRRLFGVMSDAEQSELAALREHVGLADVTAEDAEAALFGEDADLEAEVGGAAELETFEGIETEAFAGTDERGLPEALPEGSQQRGLALSLAVVLEPGVTDEVASERLEAAIDASELRLQMAGWRPVSGLLGQLIIVIRLVLYVAIGIIFVVAMVIINNSMVMAMMDRVTEIGTLRAIGARRGFVVAMFFAETLVLGLVSGLLGAGLGAALVTYWGENGLPAPSKELRFLFGGPELYPDIALSHLGWGLFTIVVVSLISTAYPAYLGASVQPVEAMRAEE